jgi:hypothetical protein
MTAADRRIGARMTDSDMLDLYEEMLFVRVAKRVRPVLYVSSMKDLECSVLILLNEAPELKLAGRPRLAASGFRHHVRSI